MGPVRRPAIGITTVATAGYGGFLAGPPLIGLIAEGSSLPVGLDLVALGVGLMLFGANAVQRARIPAAALAG